MRCKTRLASRAEWAELLERSGSGYSLSQTYEFGEAIARAYDEYSYEPRIFEFDDGTVMLLPLVRVRRRPRFIRCFEAMPFSLNGLPICVGGSCRSAYVLAAISSLRADSIRLNAGSRVSTPWDGDARPWRDAASDCTAHVLDLSEGYEAIWSKRFRRELRKDCRAGERRGLRTYNAESVQDFESYYSIYEASTKRWGYKAPPYPISLFHSLAALRSVGVELKLAAVDGLPVAGLLLFRGKETTFAWSAAMMREYAQYYPHNALYRSAIEDACRLGQRAFDFGASGHLESVRKFKENFGAQPSSYQNLFFTTSRLRLMERARKAVAGIIRK